jgi:hypothetical protein
MDTLLGGKEETMPNVIMVWSRKEIQTIYILSKIVVKKDKNVNEHLFHIELAQILDTKYFG